MDGTAGGGEMFKWALLPSADRVESPDSSLTGSRWKGVNNVVYMGAF